MNDGTRHPEDDRDRELSRRIGRDLEQKTTESESSDDTDGLYRALLELKRQVLASTERPSSEAADRIWSVVEKATTIASQPGLRRLGDRPRVHALQRVHPARWMGIAAALVVAAVVTLLVMRLPGAELAAAAESSIVEYTTADGSLVMLRPHSELYLVDESGGSARYRIEGEAFFAVVPQKTGTFSVEADDALVEVIGTRFTVSTYGQSPAVYLEEGRVRFVDVRSGSDIVLEPGQSSRLGADGAPFLVADAPAEEHLDWLDGELVFSSRRVREIAEELEQHFRIELDIDDAADNERLTGRILLDDERRSLQDLGQALGGRFAESGPRTYRFESESVD